jgi:hypothetical protein
MNGQVLSLEFGQMPNTLESLKTPEDGRVARSLENWAPPVDQVNADDSSLIYPNYWSMRGWQCVQTPGC